MAELLSSQDKAELAKHWQHFNDQHSNHLASLTTEQIEHLQQAFELSDFIYRSASQAPELVVGVVAQEFCHFGKRPNYHGLLAQLTNSITSEDELHRVLRRFRLQAMVHIAIDDLIFDVALNESLSRLSQLADALILSALNWLTQDCQKKWGVPCNSKGEAQPLLVYGMGKLGGNELNFSSDIDLIFAFPESGETVGARKVLDNQQFFTRLAQKLITALHQQTADGFVYRVDMRLRPFGESGPLVLSFSALEDYYQEQGRDWERYAMLKARLIGEGKYHKVLSKMLRPFVYRRYIDFSVIESLRKMKMMIAQEVRRKQLSNNIKLGAGGIREVEFIVQVFQLIRGGRTPALQERNLLTVLPRLVEHQALNKESMQVLKNAYCFLRRVENIIQALDDKQTQTLPSTGLDQARLISVLKIETWSEFIDVLNQHMQAVHDEFDILIGEESPNQQDVDQDWVTLWLSQWDAQESIDWLAGLAAHWQADASWHQIYDFKQEVDKKSFGGRGRQILDKLMPRLLSHLAQVSLAQDHDNLLARVLGVISKITTRTAYLELLYENEGALIHLIKLCQMSAWLSEHLAKYPILLDELIDPKLLHNPPALSEYQHELQLAMLRIPEDDIEMQMDVLRQFKQAQQLRIAAADIVEVLPVMKVSDHLTALAEAIINEAVSQAWQQITRRFGQPKSTVKTQDKGFAVIGYGKMGGSELGYGSDLDLVFIHQSPADDVTNGEKEIPASQFYVKLAQKIMHIFNTRMSSGILYELDMRLRPSGNSGVLVIHLDAFEQYQQEEAWVWEHQALVRARPVYGNARLCQHFLTCRQAILQLKRDQTELQQEVVKMRDKMREHLDSSDQNKADIKQTKGGLVDIEFIAQYLVLANADKAPALTKHSDNIRIFEQLAIEGFLSQESAHTLIEHYRYLRSVGHRAALQNAKARMPQVEFAKQSQAVISIWQEIFGSLENGQ